MSQPDTRPASVSAQPRGLDTNMSVALPPRDAAPRLLSADDDHSGGSSLPVSSDRKASNLLPVEDPIPSSTPDASDDNGRSGNVSPGEKKLDDASSTAGVGDCGTPLQQPQEGSTAQATARPCASRTSPPCASAISSASAQPRTSADPFQTSLPIPPQQSAYESWIPKEKSTFLDRFVKR